MVRYADDAVIFCELKEDAERIFKVLEKRFQKYGLKLHPEKTRLIDFKKPGAGQRKGSDSFTFLGFTHYWTKSRKRNWIVGRKTDSKRLSRAITAISAWCKANRQKTMQEQWETLKAKIIGHYAYYGITHNYRSIAKFYGRVQEVWRGWLNRRGRKGSCNWKSFVDYLKDWPLPEPKIMHKYC